MPELGVGDIAGFLRSHGPFEEPSLLATGEKVGDWKVLAFLGRGGSAEVYRAENEVTGIVGALKVLYASDERALVRFRREAQLLAESKSPAFPMFYGAGASGGRCYIAEELLEPQELPCGDVTVARFMLDVAAGVGELHRRGFVHRDIKPRNVMVRPSTGESVLIDMGLARESTDANLTRNDTESIVDGRVVGVGTPGFSAPEQFTGGMIGVAADIHALGMLANVCFGGKPPAAWASIIRRSTSSIPEQRYSSVTEFSKAIRRRHAIRWWLLALASITIAAIALWPQGDRPQTPSGDRPQETTSSTGDRPQRREIITAKNLLEVVRDINYAGCATPSEVKPVATNVTTVEKSNWQKLLALGKTRYVDGALVTRIELNGRDVTIPEEINLEGNRRVEIVGPGRLTASIAGPRGASLELSEHAVLINLTTIGYPASGMRYVLNGACYLNFKKLDPPVDKDYKNIWVGEENGTPSFRFRGPDSYEEVRKADKKAAIEAMRREIGS